MPAGRPKKYKCVEDMKKRIDEYFDFCDNRIQQIYNPKTDSVQEVVNPAPYTMSGLAVALDLDRQSVLNYAKDSEFFGTIKAAREKVHQDVETRLMEKNATGAIFNLKNNFGWKDEKGVEHSGTVSIAQQIIEEYGED